MTVNVTINNPMMLKIIPLNTEVLLKWEVVFRMACIIINPFSKKHGYYDYP